MKKKTIVKSILFLILFLFIIILLFWRQLFWSTVSFIWWVENIHIPTPAYIPKNKQWELVDKQTTNSWGLPCVYVRYKVDSNSALVAKGIKDNISKSYKWKKFKEGTSENFRKTIDKFQEAPNATPKNFVESMVPYLGDKYIFETNDPFVVYSWYEHDIEYIHHTVVARIISISATKCIVEIWDMKIYDD